MRVEFWFLSPSLYPPLSLSQSLHLSRVTGASKNWRGSGNLLQAGNLSSDFPTKRCIDITSHGASSSSCLTLLSSPHTLTHAERQVRWGGGGLACLQVTSEEVKLSSIRWIRLNGLGSSRARWFVMVWLVILTDSWFAQWGRPVLFHITPACGIIIYS